MLDDVEGAIPMAVGCRGRVSKSRFHKPAWPEEGKKPVAALLALLLNESCGQPISEYLRERFRDIERATEAADGKGLFS